MKLEGALRGEWEAAKDPRISNTRTRLWYITHVYDHTALYVTSAGVLYAHNSFDGEWSVFRKKIPDGS